MTTFAVVSPTDAQRLHDAFILFFFFFFFKKEIYAWVGVVFLFMLLLASAHLYGALG